MNFRIKGYIKHYLYEKSRATKINKDATRYLAICVSVELHETKGNQANKCPCAQFESYSGPEIRFKITLYSVRRRSKRKSIMAWP